MCSWYMLTHSTQRLRIDKMMQHPEKPVHLPAPPREQKPRAPVEIDRSATGSTAAANSGQFHVYRNFRKKERERQEYMDRVEQKVR